MCTFKTEQDKGKFTTTVQEQLVQKVSETVTVHNSRGVLILHIEMGTTLTNKSASKADLHKERTSSGISRLRVYGKIDQRGRRNERKKHEKRCGQKGTEKEN